MWLTTIVLNKSSFFDVFSIRRQLILFMYQSCSQLFVNQAKSLYMPCIRNGFADVSLSSLKNRPIFNFSMVTSLFLWLRFEISQLCLMWLVLNFLQSKNFWCPFAFYSIELSYEQVSNQRWNVCNKYIVFIVTNAWWNIPFWFLWIGIALMRIIKFLINQSIDKVDGFAS